MKNSIVVSIESYFKGKPLTPSMVLDLDALMAKSGEIPDLYPELAMANDIDLYSYELEVMMVEELRYSQPKGLAEQFFRDGEFDIAGFEKAWHEDVATEKVAEIAQREMGVEDLNAQPQLKAALLKAYQAGKADVSSRPAEASMTSRMDY